jgi:hypothetical protein
VSQVFTEAQCSVGLVVGVTGEGWGREWGWGEEGGWMRENVDNVVPVTVEACVLRTAQTPAASLFTLPSRHTKVALTCCKKQQQQQHNNINMPMAQ